MGERLQSHPLHWDRALQHKYKIAYDSILTVLKRGSQTYPGIEISVGSESRLASDQPTANLGIGPKRPHVQIK